MLKPLQSRKIAMVFLTLNLVFSASYASASAYEELAQACQTALKGAMKVLIPRQYSQRRARIRAEFRAKRRALAAQSSQTRARRDRLLRGQLATDENPPAQIESLDSVKVVDVTVENMNPFLTTIFGKARLEQILRTGFEEKELIARQEAVKYLIAHPELREEIHEQLDLIKASMEGKESTLLKMLERDRALRKATMSQMGLSGVHFGFIGAGQMAGVLLPGPAHYVGLILGVIASKVAGFSGNFSQRVRAELNQFQPFINLAHKLSEPLQSSGVETLVNVGEQFDGVKDEAVDANLAKLSQCYDKMLDARVRRWLHQARIPWEGGVALCSTSVDSLTGVTAFTLPRMRMLFEVSKGSVIALLSYAADLEVLNATAEFAIEQKDVYFFPEIVSSPTPIFKMENAYHPYSVHISGDAATAHSIELNKQNPYILLDDPNREGAGMFLKKAPAIVALGRAGLPVPGKVTMSVFKQLYKFNQPGRTLVGREALDAQLPAINAILRESADGKPCMIVMDQLVEHVGDPNAFKLSLGILNVITQKRPNCIGVIGTNYTKIAANPPAGMRVLQIHPDQGNHNLIEGPTGFDFDSALLEDGVSAETLEAYRLLKDVRP